MRRHRSRSGSEWGGRIIVKGRCVRLHNCDCAIPNSQVPEQNDHGRVLRRSVALARGCCLLSLYWQRVATSLLFLTIAIVLPIGISALPECLPDCAGADLRDVELAGFDLSWADLSGADLSRANLRGSNLSWANLSEADLSEADLQGANLSWARLHDSTLLNADLSAVAGCDFTGRLPSCEAGCTGVGAIGADDEECVTQVGHLMRTLINGSKSDVADLFDFPIQRPYPIPPIERMEFFDRYDQVLDDTLMRLILDSSPNDWHAAGWRGFYLDDGTIPAYFWPGVDWKSGGTLLLYDRIFRLNYVSEYELSERERLLSLREVLRERERLELHETLRNYVLPVLEWETDTYRIRIDYMGGALPYTRPASCRIFPGNWALSLGVCPLQRYRYSAWKVENNHSDIPDLVIQDGEITRTYGTGCGTHGGEGATYSFVNFEYLYEVDVNGCGDVPEYALRVWRSQGRNAIIPEQEEDDWPEGASIDRWFEPRDHGFILVLEEPFEDTSSDIDLVLHAYYRAQGRGGALKRANVSDCLWC